MDRSSPGFRTSPVPRLLLAPTHSVLTVGAVSTPGLKLTLGVFERQEQLGVEILYPRLTIKLNQFSRVSMRDQVTAVPIRTPFS